MTKPIDTSTPAVVLGSSHHGALAITRTLGRMGISVHNLDHSAWAPAFSSRYCQTSHKWDLDSATPTDSINMLTGIARRLGRKCVLLPITDLGALFVADHATALQGNFLFQSQSPRLVRALYNKRLMQGLARQAGLATPNAFFPNCKSDAETFLKAAEFPLFYKAADGLAIAQRGLPTKRILKNRREGEDLFRRLSESDMSDVILQEYIPGEEDTVWMFDGCFDNRSNCLFGITGRKIRQYPPYIGASSLAVCEENPEVDQAARRFMKAIGYKGIVDMGFRFDQRDGSYKVLDVNPRIGSSFRLFSSDNEMDVVRSWYCALTGQSVDPGHPMWGRKWIVEDLDLVSSLRHFFNGDLKLKHWGRSLRDIQETAVFAKDDTRGGLAVLRADFINLLKPLGRAARKLSASGTADNSTARHRIPATAMAVPTAATTNQNDIRSGSCATKSCPD